MSLPGASRVAASWRLLRAVLRPAPEALTLGQVRSDLSHEAAAKLARLAGLIQDWQRGNVRVGDASDAETILHDLERIHLRHARLAAASFATFARLTRLLGTVRRGHGWLRSPRGSGPPPRAIARFDELHRRLRRDSEALCESLSSLHGARFAGVVGEAVEELRSETGDADAGGVAIGLEGLADARRSWVPRGDVASWADIVRNLVRNAVQATEEARVGRPSFAVGGEPPRRVTVRVLPLRGQPGVALEVLDEGVGMSPATTAAMWRAGSSRHGGHHGQGLTEAKRSFIESRGALEVRSAEGVGTCVRVDVPDHDVQVHGSRLWALPPIVAPALAVLAAAVLALPLFARRDIVSVSVQDDRVVQARDARGRLVWQRDLHENVERNFLGYTPADTGKLVPVYRHLVLPARGVWPSNVILATRPAQGPGHLWRLGFAGRTVWKRTLRWNPPRPAHTGSLKSVFQATVPWGRGAGDVVAVNVRDADWGSTAMQFFTLSGDSLGAYHHPGHLDYRATMDLDGDGRVELILNGRNNRAPEDSLVYPEPPGYEWVDCLLMLEPSRAHGQAYPYAGWAGMRPAREEAYLLVPPMRRGPKTDERERPAIDRVDFGPVAAPGGARVELRMADGRIYVLDSQLRPLSCGVGSETYAATLAPTRALAPLLYFHDGRRETIDLPILRGP